MRLRLLAFLATCSSGELIPQFALRAEQLPVSRSAQSTQQVNTDLPPFKYGNFTRRESNGTACKTSGEKQWTGTIDVTDDRRLFYWFFDSKNQPAKDDVIIWLNGGPGASSMRGLFNELGPCLLHGQDNTTTLNPHSWNKNASLLVIDQPAGVGFSQVKPGGTYAASDTEAARDLQTFLRIFFDDVFSDRSHVNVHFAGESYAGHYIPATVKYILDSRESSSKDAFWGNITSMILVNSLIAEEQTSIGFYELFCSDYRGKLWPEDICKENADKLPELERAALKCNALQDGPSCNNLTNVNQARMEYLFQEVMSKKRNWYFIEKPCPNPTKCEPPTVGNFTAYLNRPEVLESIGFPSDFVYKAGSNAAGEAIDASDERSQPRGGSLAAILDAATTYSHRQGQADIRLFVLNGSEDALCNTPGTKIVYERLAWSGAAGYRAHKWKSFNELGLRMGTGEWKRDEKRQMLFVAVNDAGHMVPMDQPDITDWLIRNWINGCI